MGDRLVQFVKAYLAGRVRHWPSTPEQTAAVRAWAVTGHTRVPPS